MKGDKDSRTQAPGLITVLVLIGVATGVWRIVTGDIHPPVEQTDSSPEIPVAGVAGTGWVKPVDAPVWGGFRTSARPDHQGVDLGAARGAEIRAAAAGEVVRARCDTKPVSYGCDRDGSAGVRGCGWYVDLRHADNIYTRYCHMQTAPAVTLGQAVTAGQVLGQVGSSGNSGAPHLHFEVHLGSQSAATAVDPVGFMAAHGAPLG